MLSIIIIISVGVGVTALVGAAAFAMRPQSENAAEDRLSELTGKKRANGKSSEATLLTSNSLDDTKTAADELLSKIGNIRHLMEQADVEMSGAKFITICLVLAGIGSAICLATPAPKYLLPLFAIALGILPVFWLVFKRNKRMSEFNKQLPEALELISRSLRAGHSLAAGFGLVADE